MKKTDSGWIWAPDSKGRSNKDTTNHPLYWPFGQHSSPSSCLLYELTFFSDKSWNHQFPWIFPNSFPSLHMFPACLSVSWKNCLKSSFFPWFPRFSQHETSIFPAPRGGNAVALTGAGAAQVAFLGRWQGGRGSSRRCSYGTVSFAVNFRGSSAAAGSYGYRPINHSY